MKKVKLQMLGLSVNDLLSREQMKKVMGGSGGGSGSGSGAFGTCSVTTTCFMLGQSVGSVSCNGSGANCHKGDTWVQCDSDPRVSC